MELGQVQEDYLEAIYVLREQTKEVKCVRIAEYMGRSKPTILTAMKILEEKGYYIRKLTTSGFYGEDYPIDGIQSSAK